jgi:2-phosphosulfolactate phosphatase
VAQIHLLLKKEEIDEEKIKGKTAVILDVLLATSTIASVLHLGAREVIPVRNREEALVEASGREPDSFLLVGEEQGYPLEGFFDPLTIRSKDVKAKTIILLTTNGTVAVRRSIRARHVYIGCLLNGHSVADRLRQAHRDETIVMVCSGSSGSFCLEDFYGAGYVLDCLLRGDEHEWKLTDAAQAALMFYQANPDSSSEILRRSSVGQMMIDRGFAEEMDHVSQFGSLPLVPYVKGNRIQMLQ